MMGTEIFKIDASWAEKLTKTRVPFLSAPTVILLKLLNVLCVAYCNEPYQQSAALTAAGPERRRQRSGTMGEWGLTADRRQ